MASEFLALQPKTVVLVSTSAADLKGYPTGLWLEELAAPYYIFKNAGFEVVITSTEGGAIPIDGGSLAGDYFTAETKKFMHDGEAFAALTHSVRISAIDWESANVEAIFTCGGHGVEVDFVHNDTLKRAIETLYNANKIVASVCHGPVCLAQCNKANGEPLVKGLVTTGFSNSEERGVGLTEKCAWLIEDKFKELGAIYEAGGDWTSNVKVAGNLITGQNPQSAVEAAHAVVSALATPRVLVAPVKMALKPKTIVLVSTNASYIKDHPTGLWMEEMAAPYYIFKDAGFEVVIASTRGGPVPIDGGSLVGDYMTAEAKKFCHDGEAFAALSHSVRLSAIDWESENVKAIVTCGGHGVESDFVQNDVLKRAIETMYTANKIVASVCHGPVCLAQCKKANGEPLVKGLVTTGFSNSEERGTGLTEKCAWLIEDKFKELGAIYEAGGDWSSNVKVAGNLITGQNPQSSVELANAVVSALK